MAYSYDLKTGDGTTTVFGFNIPFLDRAHVAVKVNGVLTAFTWLTDSTISVVPAPVAAAIVEIRRVTPKDTPAVNFTDGSVLLEDALNKQALFELYLAQEGFDNVQQSILQNSVGKWDGQGRVATNFADPVGATDLMTKNYFDVTYSGYINGSVAAAAASALLAQNYKNAAAVSETNADASADDAAMSLQDFRRRYQGESPTSPATRYDGTPLEIGDLFFNSTDSAMKVWTGILWVAAASSVNGIKALFKFVATAGQTVFAGADVNGNVLEYDPGFINGYFNGFRLDPTDMTATTGTSVTLATGAGAGDELNFEAFGTFTLASFSGMNLQDATVTLSKLVAAAYASQAEAEGGVENTKLMTALRVKQAITANAIPAIPLASSAEVSARTNTAKQVTPQSLQGLLVNGTPQATTSGTSIDFTGIPSWAKKITVMLSGVSTNGSSVPLIQIGTAGGVETTVYSCIGVGIGTSTGAGFFNTGFGLSSTGASASDTRSGSLVLTKQDGNTWVANGQVAETFSSFMYSVAGTKTLAGTLDRVRLTTVGGTNTFDAGSANILYE